MIRILLVEPTTLWRAALSTVLSYEDDLEVIAEFGRIDEAIPVVRTVRPDVAVVDVGVLADNGELAETYRLHKALPDCAILGIADPPAAGTMRDALATHVRGLVGKNTGPAQLARDIRRVAGGERVIDPTLAVAALCAPPNPLTGREREILKVASSGVPSVEIAMTLHLSVGTVRNYLSTIIRKTGGRNRIEALRIAEEAGWM